MEVIYIKQANHSGKPVYLLSAVAIRTKEGRERLIPHPYGSESASFETVEAAITAAHRAGYDVEWDGKLYAVPTKKQPSATAIPKMRVQNNIWSILDAVVPLLEKQLLDSTPSVVANALFALGEIRSTASVPKILNSLGHDDQSVRKQASEALAKMGQASLPSIVFALKDANWVVRLSAIQAMIELLFHARELIPSVLHEAQPLLSDENWLVRSHTAQLFGECAKLFHAIEEKQP